MKKVMTEDMSSTKTTKARSFEHSTRKPASATSPASSPIANITFSNSMPSHKLVSQAPQHAVAQEPKQNMLNSVDVWCMLWLGMIIAKIGHANDVRSMLTLAQTVAASLQLQVPQNKGMTTWLYFETYNLYFNRFWFLGKTDLKYERYDMIWYDMIWYDMIWYDMIW